MSDGKKEEKEIEMKPMLAAAASEDGAPPPETKPAEPDDVIEAITKQARDPAAKWSIKQAPKSGSWLSSEPLALTWQLSIALSERLPMSIVQIKRPASGSAEFELHVDGERQASFTASDETTLSLTHEMNGKKLEVYSIAMDVDNYGFMIGVDGREVCSGEPVHDILHGHNIAQVRGGLIMIVVAILFAATTFYLTQRPLFLIAPIGLVIGGLGMIWRGQFCAQYSFAQNDQCRWLMTRV